jgi:hypothetical protein
MNDYDESVGKLDAALRDRFFFFDYPPKENVENVEPLSDRMGVALSRFMKLRGIPSSGEEQNLSFVNNAIKDLLGGFEVGYARFLSDFNKNSPNGFQGRFERRWDGTVGPQLKKLLKQHLGGREARKGLEWTLTLAGVQDERNKRNPAD